MEDYLVKRDIALKNLKTADHLLNVTYPIVKDPKLFLSVLDHLFLALLGSVTAILHYELHYRRVAYFKDNFQEKYDLFVRHCIKPYNINKDYLDFILSIKSLVIAHQKSSMEFVRKENIVICDDKYSCKTIDVNLLRSYIDKSRMFVYLINNILHTDQKNLAKINYT
ncbi:hypothetical protein HYU06_06695 [Candidatus Woesearchaeota archaeon]|nr:hypothetical protein [Candidatus Woesearchaeota archaeon]